MLFAKIQASYNRTWPDGYGRELATLKTEPFLEFTGFLTFVSTSFFQDCTNNAARRCVFKTLSNI